MKRKAPDNIFGNRPVFGGALYGMREGYGGFSPNSYWDRSEAEPGEARPEGTRHFGSAQ
ncbi:MAG: hypothetical protein GY754_15240 [bacterium]|nr:hypothetical protein [bacterium]